VVIHSVSRPLAYHNVGLDSRLGGELAARHLLSLGYHRTMFFMQDSRSWQAQEIYQGFQDAFRQQQAPWDQHQMREIDSGRWNGFFPAAYHAVRELPELPRAIFCIMDTTAYGVLKALKERGVRVPQDVAVMGFDDERIHPFMDHELTTIHHPIEEKSAAAVNLLLEILANRQDRGQVRQIILKPHLVVRSTC
jgi:LacI family transcriptional regulator